MSGTSAGSKLGSISGNITKARNRKDEKTMKALIKEYNEIARREGYNLYREGFKVSKKSAKVKEVIAGYAPITTDTPLKDEKKKVRRQTLNTTESTETNIIPIRGRGSPAGSRANSPERKKAPAKAKGVKKIGSVPDVIQGKAQRGRTAVVKKDLTKNILDYEKEKYQEKKKEASKDIKIINMKEEKMRNKK